MHRSSLPSWLLIAFLVVVSVGCSKKIVKPDGAESGASQPYASGPVTERVLQTVQADLKVIYFDYDQYVLSPAAQTALRENADILKKASQVKVVAEGHCDERGTTEYNLALGERRARAVVEYLGGVDIPMDRTSTVSFGSEAPADTGRGEDSWAKNRRVYLRATR